jgi:hypothetical protein
MTAAQQNTFNAMCCSGGAGSCVAVSFSDAPVAQYNLPVAEADSAGMILRTRILNGTPPFTMLAGVTIIPNAVYVIVSGNVVNIWFNTLAPGMQIGIIYNLDFTIENCNGSQVVYSTTFQFTN